jgi:hypothetical protein
MAAHGKPASIADNLIAAGDAPPVKVLIIDGEMILSDLKARTAAIFKSNGQNQLLENLRLYAKSDQDPVAQFIDLAQPAWKTRIIAEVKNQGFSLVIFDNLSTLSPSLEDENSAVAWNPLNDLL